MRPLPEAARSDMAAEQLTSPAAIVLTGGLSRRMGTDKAALVVDGETMLDRILKVLAEADVHRVAVAGSAELPDPEPRPGDDRSQGPMAGIVSGWRHLQAPSSNAVSIDPVVVLSCDLPALPPEVVTALIAASRDRSHGALAHDGERPQPLIAAYRPLALDAIEAAFLAGERSVRRCFDGWDLAQVERSAEQLADADRPEDLRGFDVEWPGAT